MTQLISLPFLFILEDTFDDNANGDRGLAYSFLWRRPPYRLPRCDVSAPACMCQTPTPRFVTLQVGWWQKAVPCISPPVLGYVQAFSSPKVLAGDGPKV